LSQQYKDKSVEDLQKEQEKANELLNSEYCKKCDSCPTTPSPKPSAPPVVVPPTTQPTASTAAPVAVCDKLTGKDEKFVCSYMYNNGVTDNTELAQLLAQLKHESINFTRITENLSYSAEGLLQTFKTKFTPITAAESARNPQKTANIAYANILDNGPPSTGDGYKYRGRGYIQLTGKTNYAAFASYSGKDVVSNPDLLATDKTVAAAASLYYWNSRVKPRVTNFADTTAVTKKINAAKLGLAERDNFFKQYLSIFNSTRSGATSSKIVAPTKPTVTPAPLEYPKTVSYTGKDSGTIIRVQVLLDQPGKTQPTQKLFNAGYRNGRINTNNLVDVGGGFYLIADAAAKWKELVAAANADGVNISISEGYRSLDKQIQFIKNNGLYGNEAPADSSLSKGKAAQPGKSNHGWAIAFDLNVGGKSFESNATYRWLRKNAARFQFKDTVRGGSPDEPWHWEYIGPITKISPTDTEPVGPSEVTTTPPITSTPIVPQVPTEAAAAPRTAPVDVKVCSDDAYLEIARLKNNGLPSFDNFSLQNKINAGKIECAKCDAAKKVVAQLGIVIEEKEKVKAATDRVTREFPGLQNTFRYVEIFPDYMAASIADSADGDMSNAFGSAPGSLSISADLVMPGINGIRVGELFWIDRIPTFYRTFGAFQIISVEDTIDVGGWKTKIYSQFNYLGKNWKDAMLSKFREATT
jgi:putative chitinase